MEVILRKDIPSLGRIGDIVRVREGYARNYLIPRSLAAMASSSNKSQLEHHKRLVALHKKKVQKESEALVESKKGLSFTLVRRFNETGKIYGAVTAVDLVDELTKLGIQADKRDLDFVSPKEAGSFALKVRLPGDVQLTVTVNLEAETEAEEGSKKTAKAGAKSKAKKTAKPRKAKEEADSESSEETASE